MLSKDERVAKLKKIGELSGDNEEVLDLLSEISQDYDEVESLPTYTDDDVKDSSTGKRWKDMYELEAENYQDLKKKYRDRFFSSGTEVKNEQKEDIEKDDKSTEISFDDLFKEKEGEE